MPAITIYSKETCPYCDSAKRLLASKGQSWTEIDIEAEPARRDEMIERSGQRTVPQIWIGDRHVGGFDDLAALEDEGELDALLGVRASAPAPAEHVRLLIIGSGPAGWTAALYAARAELQPVVVAGLMAGGQLMLTTDVENYPGFPEGISGPEMMDRFQAQAVRFGARVYQEDATRDRPLATPVPRRDLRARLHGRRRDPCDGRVGEVARNRVRAAADEPRRLRLRDLRRRALQGQGDGRRRRRRHSDGGGAVPHALRAARHRDPPPRQVARVEDHGRARGAQREDPVPLGFRDRRGARRRVRRGRTRAQPEDGAKTDIALEALFVAIGHKPNTDLVDGQVALDDTGYIKVESGSSRTSIEGVFACGDATDPTYRQAVTAAGTGCMAAIDAERWLAAQGLE